MISFVLMEVDFIIVGFGLAGMAMCKELEDHQHSFIVIDNDFQVSSKVAAGVFNPVILKRFTPVWNAKEQLENLFPYYEDLKGRLGKEYLTYFDTYKVFKSIEDQNNWFGACDKPLLAPYLNPNIDKEPIHGIQYFNGFGKVKSTGRVLVKEMIKDYKKYIKAKNQLLEDAFVYDDLEIHNNMVLYKGVKSKYIVFAEGFGLKKNPFFNDLPLTGTKGEMLFVKAPNLKLQFQIKSSLFVLPVGNDIYWVGATFNNKDKSAKPTNEGRKELVDKLKTIITVPFEVIEQFAGIRPTVKDRKPMLGKHAKFNNLFIFNGLGTRGVMIAPTAAKKLYQYIINNQPLPIEIDVNRFRKTK